MHSISDEQIDFILNDITKRGVEIEDVKFNILDHVCCIIENEMPSGGNFNEFYKNTIARFYRKELKEIEDEAIELTTFKYYYAMKRTLKITGAATIILCLLGALFKFQHWPGAGVLLLLSLGSFGLIFIPLNIIMKFRDEKESTNKFIITFGFVLGMTITFGILFKIFHWPGANIMMLGALAVFALIFTPIYFFTRYRNPETKFNAIVHTTFMIAGSGLLFGLVNLKPSNHVEESVESMDAYQNENIERIQESNNKLYSQIEESTLKLDVKDFSSNLSEKIADIETNLIAKSNGISFEDAEGKTLEDVNNPNDSKVILNYYQQSKDEYSHAALLSEIEAYNAAIAVLDNGDVMRPISLESLQMENTIVSVVLHELLDIKVQVLSNENSYLCLQKGLLATN